MEIFDQRPPLTEEKQVLLPKLRAEIGPLFLERASADMLSETTLIRFLRGYPGDLVQAANAFRFSVEWRFINQIDMYRSQLQLKETCSTTLEQIIAHYTDFSRLPHWHRVGSVYPEKIFQGHDGQMNPILVTTHGMIEHIYGLLTVLTAEEFEEFRIARLVFLELYLEALGRRTNRIVKVVYVWNLAGMTRQLWKQWEAKPVKKFFGEFDFESNYACPEQVHRIFALNVPTWLLMLWNVLKRMVPGRLMKRITVLGSNASMVHVSKEYELPIEVLQGSPVLPLPLLPSGLVQIKTIVIPSGSLRVVEIALKTRRISWSIHISSGNYLQLSIEHLIQGKRSHFLKPFRVDEFHQAHWIPPDGSNQCVLRLTFDSRGMLFGFMSRTVDILSMSN